MAFNFNQSPVPAGGNPNQSVIPTFNLPTPTTFGDSRFNNTNPASRPSTSLSPNLDVGANGSLSPVPNFDGSTLANTLGLDTGNFAKDTGAFDGFFSEAGGSRFLIPGLEALTGLAGLSQGKKLLNLGRDQFNFSKDTSNRDFNAQADITNNNIRNSAAQGFRNTGRFDTSTPEGKAAFDKSLDEFVAQNSVKNITL